MERRRKKAHEEISAQSLLLSSAVKKEKGRGEKGSPKWRQDHYPLKTSNIAPPLAFLVRMCTRFERLPGIMFELESGCACALRYR